MISQTLEAVGKKLRTGLQAMKHVEIKERLD